MNYPEGYNDGFEDGKKRQRQYDLDNKLSLSHCNFMDEMLKNVRKGVQQVFKDIRIDEIEKELSKDE